MSLKKPKLTVDMIPKTCWFSNVRSTVTKKEWDTIRFTSYAYAKNKCEICKNTGKKQGFRHDLECHEIWSFNDETREQKLVGVISLCPICHLTKHFGKASAMGKQAIVMKQLEMVNGWDHKDVVTHLAQAYKDYKERSKHQWTLDISILADEPYLIKLKETKNRIFKPNKWVKKKRRRRKKKV